MFYGFKDVDHSVKLEKFVNILFSVFYIQLSHKMLLPCAL